MDIIALVNRRIAAALSALRQPFRARLTRITTTGGVQTAQLDAMADETLQSVEVFQHYGLTSVPPDGAMAVVLPLGNRSSHGIVIATEHSQYRIQALQSGEVAIYTDEGAAITLKRGRVISTVCDDYQLTCKTFSVNASESATFTTPQLTATERVTAQGLLTGSGGMAISGDNGQGQTASFAGDIAHTDGRISSEAITVKGVNIETHRHNTPDGMSDGPQN